MQIALIIIILALVAAYFIITYKPKHSDNLKDLYSEGLDLMVDGYRQGAYENFKKIISIRLQAPFIDFFSYTYL